MDQRRNNRPGCETGRRASRIECIAPRDREIDLASTPMVTRDEDNDCDRQK